VRVKLDLLHKCTDYEPMCHAVYLCRVLAYVEYSTIFHAAKLGSLPAPQGTESPKVRGVLWDVIKAIEHVHYHGIVHCDIKLANVVVELHSDGQCPS